MSNTVNTEWVKCPVCDEPDMRKETDAEGNSLILCVNHACLSNGGTNSKISNTISEELLKRVADDWPVGSCNCLTKTPEVKFHKPGCKYRLIMERNAWKQVAEKQNDLIKSTIDGAVHPEIAVRRVMVDLAPFRQLHLEWESFKAI